MAKISHKAPGILMLGPYGPYRNAVWLLVNEDEAALVEMPPYRRKRDARPWFAARRCLKQVGARLKYGLLTHAHIDHCQNLMEFRKAFPQASFVAHRSQLENMVVGRLSGWRPYDVFDQVFDGDVFMLELGGEPIVLIHAPKHSYSDTFIIYKGTAITGDWFMGDLNDCNAIVHPSHKIYSIERVQSWLRRLDYRVDRAFSGHGDCLYYRVDFDKLLEDSKIDHLHSEFSRL